MSLLPKTTSDFAQIDYWDKFFKKRGNAAFEWYGDYPELCGILHKYIRIRDKILVIGCGNSALSHQMYDVGYKNIVNIDTSKVVIKQMKTLATLKGKEGLEFHVMDATNTNFDDGMFNVVLDKGTLDALMPDSSPKTLAKIDKLFNEVDRVLAPLGRYVCVSLLQQHILNHLLKFFSSLGWLVRICRCEEAEKLSAEAGNGYTFPVFVVICTKLKKVCSKPLFEVCQSGDSIVKVATVEDTLAAVKVIQDMALVCSGLNRCSLGDLGEVTVELTRPGDIYPRYTVTVADSPKLKQIKNTKFAAFIVPQGREREWLFGSPEGRQVLVENSGFDRLAVIRLHREHKYENLKATQDETAETILKLAPNYKGPRPKIPFLSVAEDLGNVKEIARGESEISGGFIVEDVEGVDRQLFRRLVFLANQNAVQSEVKLKKVEKNGESRTEIDIAHLACEYHMYMTLGVSMVATDDSPFDALIIGLGGGGLCTYIYTCFPMIRLTGVDIDPVVLEVATKYFDFKQNDHLQVVIEDGLNYLKTAVSKGKKYNTILFDVDSKDSSLGLTCPPESFLEPDILQAAADCISETGIFLLNFVCRVKEIREKTWHKLEKIYKGITSVKLEQDVNEIFFCVKNKPTLSLEDAADKFNKIVINKQIQEDDLIDKEELPRLIRFK